MNIKVNDIHCSNIRIETLYELFRKKSKKYSIVVDHQKLLCYYLKGRDKKFFVLSQVEENNYYVYLN